MNTYDSAGTQLFRYNGGPDVFIDTVTATYKLGLSPPCKVIEPEIVQARFLYSHNHDM